MAGVATGEVAGVVVAVDESLQMVQTESGPSSDPGAADQRSPVVADLSV